MQTSRAARRYAAAIFELAKEEGRTREVRRELDTLKGLLDRSEELRRVLLTPLHPVEQRKRVLRSISEAEGLSKTVQNFYSYIIDRRRLLDFAAIREEYIRLEDEASGLIKAVVTVASEVDERRKDRLRRALSQRTGREVQLDVVVDGGLVGGAIAKVGDLVFDGSIRTQLGQLRTNLLRD